MTTKEKILRTALPIGAVLASIGIGFAGITSAQTASGTNTAVPVQNERGMGMHGEKPAVMGKITAISGTTLTVEGKNRDSATAVAYTVEAASAKIMKGAPGTAPSETTLSTLAVGDMIAVRGTLTGTSVSATEIMSGMGMHGMGGRGKHGTRGTVTSVSGNTITITGENGTTYTVDASSATVGKVTTISVGDIKVGDTLNVMGEVSGTNVSAKHIMDGVPPRQ